MSPMPPTTPLGLDPDLLASCVSCGLCLPHCPTFRVTGHEALSPRGRIEAMRAVEQGQAVIDTEFTGLMETCVQCRACEPACPSGVQFGRLMEQTRVTLAERPVSGRFGRIALRLGLGTVTRPGLLRRGTRLLALAQRLHLIPRRFSLPSLPLRPPAALRPTGADIWLFTGCVMDAWMRDTHRATIAVAEAMGFGVALAEPPGQCCGALHIHSGDQRTARRLALETMTAYPGDAPIIVDAAGCGAAMKEYGHLVDTDAAHRFSERVMDIHEWMSRHLDRLAEPVADREPVVIQDPCHLRHVQRRERCVYEVLEPYAQPVALDDDGLCCGAGGAYFVTEPKLAAAMRDRKVEAICAAANRSGARIVASANPGCLLQLQQPLRERGIEIRHPVEIIAAALS